MLFCAESATLGTDYAPARSRLHSIPISGSMRWKRYTALSKILATLFARIGVGELVASTGEFTLTEARWSSRLLMVTSHRNRDMSRRFKIVLQSVSCHDPH